jgi:hypothetical protein
MKKILLGLFLLVIIALGAGVYYVYTHLDSLVEMAIEKFGSEATQTAVRVDRVRIKLQDGSAGIYGLSVSNPEGFEMSSVFDLGEISTRLDIKNTNKDLIVIDQITITALQVFYEMNGARNVNLSALLNNLGGGSSSTPQSSASSPAPKLIIRKLSFTEGSINALIVPLENRTYDLKLPPIVMSNLGGKNGAPPEEIARQIVKTLSDRALAAVKSSAAGAEIEKARQQLDAKKQALKTETNQKVESEKAEAEAKAKDKLKNLLSK